MTDGENGVMFEKQTVKSLEEAMLRFENLKFDRNKVSRSAEKFGEDRFVRELEKVVEGTLKEEIERRNGREK